MKKTKFLNCWSVLCWLCVLSFGMQSCNKGLAYAKKGCHPLAIYETYEYDCSDENTTQTCTGYRCYFSSVVFFVSTEYNRQKSKKWSRIEMDFGERSGSIGKVLYPVYAPNCNDTGTFTIKLKTPYKQRWYANIYWEDGGHEIVSNTIVSSSKEACISVDLMAQL